MKIKFYTCDVFTTKPFGGNQLAVIPNAENIPEHLLQSITKEFNFSETVFIYPPINPKHTKRVRIFTPGGELPFAGHPTIGAAITLASMGEIVLPGNITRIVLEEGIGSIQVSIRFDNGNPPFAQLTAAQLPESNDDTPSIELLAMMLNLSRDEFNDAQFPLQFVSVGYPFLFVAVKNRIILQRIRVNTKIMEEMKLQEVFVFTNDAEQSDFQFRARMFAPLLGIPEDPATGSACAAFAGYLAEKDPVQDGTLKWNVEQGFEMGRPSLLYIEADKQNGSIVEVRVGGSAVMMTEGMLSI